MVHLPIKIHQYSAWNMRALRHCTGLRLAGATAISTALQNNSTLVVLELPGNNVSAQGASALVLS
jgi:hypothetical protein